tara:strand:- start:294 stop:890 length:597 start_codon:yes stop_codon:yes gene_type:complete
MLLICGISLQAQTKKTLPKSTIIIPPKQVVRIDYPYMKGFSVKIWNESKFELGVSARGHQTDSISKGFGLNKDSFATIQVAEKHYLQLENRFIAPLEIEYTLFKLGSGKKKKTVLDRTVGFYLVNTTAQTLPILIPGIMNPKLTPFSQSGVELPWGQKILLKTPGEDLLLLTVSDTIRKGARIDVADLIDAALNPSDK